MGEFESPRIGDLVPMRGYTMVKPHISVTYTMPDRKRVAVFMLLGHEPKDGSAPLDGAAVLDKLGWQVKPDLPAILERASMDKYECNTGVVRNTDARNGDLRVSVTSAHDNAFGDCVCLSTYIGDKVWTVRHFSPARARLIAHHLLRHADALEQANGTKPIDHQTRKRK